MVAGTRAKKRKQKIGKCINVSIRLFINVLPPFNDKIHNNEK